MSVTFVICHVNPVKDEYQCWIDYEWTTLDNPVKDICHVKPKFKFRFYSWLLLCNLAPQVPSGGEIYSRRSHGH